MVDFNNEATVTSPSADIVKMLILEKRNNLLLAIEEYDKLRFNNSSCRINVIKARLHSLFYEVKQSLKKSKEFKEKSDFQEKLESSKYEDLLEIFDLIDSWLYSKQLTKFDFKTTYDFTDIELDNKMHNS